MKLPLILLSVSLIAISPAAWGQPARVLEQPVEFPGAGGETPAHLYAPEGGGRRPGVLVLHTSAGPGPNVEAFARRLATEGFVTLTPDLFNLHEFGPEGRFDHPLVLKDVEGAVAFLKDHPRVDPARLGVVGYSFGGRMAILAAAAHPELKAAVVYYAVASFQALATERPVDDSARRSRPLTERVRSIRAAVLIHHGGADGRVPVQQGEILHRALLGAGKASSLHVYPGADHLFNFSLGPDATTHHPEVDALSWERTLAFLRRHLF